MASGIQDNKALKLEKRKEIYSFVRKYAGCHFRDIERKIKLPASSLKYHLNYLVKHGLLIEEKRGNNICYFPKDFNGKNKTLLSLLRQDSIRKILLFIMANENCGQADIAEFTKFSPSTVSWHLHKLESGSIIFSDKEGRSVKYKVADESELMNLLISYQESFFDSLVNRVIEMWEE